MFKEIVFSLVLFLGITVNAATNTFVVKPFNVANTNNPNVTVSLVGTATMLNTNSPFFVYTNSNFNVPPLKTTNVWIGFKTSGWPYGRYTNFVVFQSNGGNSTNMVYGALIPNAVANFQIK